MADILDDIEQQRNFTDDDIFIKIWTSPRKVFKYINDTKYDEYVTILLVLSGIARAFDRASVKNMGDTMPLWGIFGVCIIMGGLFGWISYYVYAALVSWTGKWLEGKGNTDSILRIISYAMIPSIAALVLLIPQITIYESEIFKSDGDITSAGLIPNILVYSSMFLEFVLGVWTIVFCVIGVSEVQKFSIGKSILNLLLPILLFGVPILLILLLTEKF